MFTRDGTTSSSRFTSSEDHPGAIEARLLMSPETLILLEQLATLAHQDMGDVIAKGLALLSLAAQAKREGKEIGIGREGQPLEMVIDVF